VKLWDKGGLKFEKRYNRDGDPRFLESALRCIRLRSEMLGLVEPVRYVRIAEKVNIAEVLERGHVEQMLAARYTQPTAEPAPAEEEANPN
jgi:hypothetical protein